MTRAIVSAWPFGVARRSRRAACLALLASACGIAAQDPGSVRTIESSDPTRTAALLERLGFEAQRRGAEVVVRGGTFAVALRRAPRTQRAEGRSAAPALGSADRPLQVTVDDVGVAGERLGELRPAPSRLIASPSGAIGLRVEAPGGVVLILRAGADAQPDAVVVPAPGELNPIVLELLRAYPTDGTHPYHWPKTGTWKGCTKDLEYGGQLLCEGDPEGRAYCCGLTFEVFLDAWRIWCQRNARPWRIAALDLEGVRRLQQQWFGSSSDPSCLHTALVDNRLGLRVTDRTDARAGDFVQLWRANGSGHSVVFLGWERSGGELVGMRYWSTQGATRGIGERTEWFDERGGDRRLDPARLWICRVGIPPRDRP
ncbi:MAG: hypothetical protein IPM29_06500 [Planctomycetes bacterium]|nr:hypothetical protein [Planctomycetota bacterium]